MAGIEGIGTGGGIRVPGELPDPLRSAGVTRPGAGPPAPSETKAPGFAETIGEYANGVNQLQHRSDDTFRAFLRGQAELHDVALASHEASIAMRLTSEIRNKLIDAYREVMRMPM